MKTLWPFDKNPALGGREKGSEDMITLQLSLLEIILIVTCLTFFITIIILWSKIMSLKDMLEKYQLIPTRTLLLENNIEKKQIGYVKDELEEYKRKNRERVKKYREKKKRAVDVNNPLSQVGKEKSTRQG